MTRRYPETPLPTPDQRMTPGRKARIVKAVTTAELSFEEALTRYGMTPEEFQTWWGTINTHGVAGLKRDSIQQRRGAVA